MTLATADEYVASWDELIPTFITAGIIQAGLGIKVRKAPSEDDIMGWDEVFGEMGIVSDEPVLVDKSLAISEPVSGLKPEYDLAALKEANRQALARQWHAAQAPAQAQA